MRLQLKMVRSLARCAAVLVTIWISAPDSHADGEVELRGAFYKEEASRVVQPMLDIQLDIGENLQLESHVLVDSITSASVASGAAGDEFSETRMEGGAALVYRIGDYQIGAFGRYSNEPDYKSLFGGVRAAVELAEKNTTVGMAAAAGTDDISNAGAQSPMGQVGVVEDSLTTVLGSASLSQIISPVLAAGITYDLSYLNGFQANPYRSVFGGGTRAPERVPETRVRHAVFGIVRRFVPRTRSTLIAGYRFYIDDWDMTAHTPEVRVVQALRPADLKLHLRARYHRQSSAYFYKSLYQTLDPAVEPYVTEDAKLSSFTAHTYGFMLEVPMSLLGVTGLLGPARIEVLFDYVVQRNRFGNAVSAQIGFAVPFTN